MNVPEFEYVENLLILEWDVNSSERKALHGNVEITSAT